MSKIDNTDDLNKNQNTGFTFKRASALIRKLHISSGDMILLKRGSTLANEMDMSRLADAFGIQGIQAVIAVVENFDDLTVLDEREMNKLGWIRTRRLLPVKKVSLDADAKKDGNDDKK